MTRKAFLCGRRAATEGRPYNGLRTFIRLQRNGIGSVAAVVTCIQTGPNCPVGAGPRPARPPWTMTPVGRDDSARRTLQGFALRGESLCPRRQRDQNAAGGVPPLRDDKKSVPLRQTGGHRGPPLQRFKDLHKITTKWNRFRGCGGDLYINRPKLPRRGGSQTRPSSMDHDARRAR